MKLSTKTLVGLVGLGLLAAAAAIGGCSGGGGEASPGNSGSGSGSGSGGSGGSGETSGSGFGNGGEFDVGSGTGDKDGGLNEDTACIATRLQADYQQRPADIIFIIDNSGSMTDEINSVQRNINQNFASIIAASKIDYRVIMLSKHGSSDVEQSVCIEAPLGSGSCSPVPQNPNTNPPHFYQYSLEIGSLDSLCLAIDTLNGAIPPKGEATSPGWSQWLRTDSLKVFVEITDDGVNCTTRSLGADKAVFEEGADITLFDIDDDEPANKNVAGGTKSAEAFDAALTAVAPELFGSKDARNYKFFSFVGIKENTPPTAPWPPEAPATWEQCRPDSVDPGTTYQVLSVMTGGLRYPIQQHATYDAVFQAIADSVISGAKLSCEIEVPKAPDGHSIDLKTVQIEFTPSNGGQKQTFAQVKSLEECAGASSSFYIEEGIIKLCEDTCAMAAQDNTAGMELLYGCSVNPN
ncbi:hypothetical protein [Sorangium atrum]|uniref:VWFA domain-containing protein n=1 Tax=Sorangium atrum TaxID=2995308 RepID=A0ABT5CBU2_9BACT|nr:hypothetical protein [Sorangium aterium]MDC0682597.1 hypothetical protein [Sorangium aterium]